MNANGGSPVVSDRGPDARDQPLVDVRGIGRRRPGGGWLLHDVSLALRPGERLALLGPTGSGKTLLLRALALLDPPDAGEVLWRGRPVATEEIPAYRRRVIYLHQRPALFEGSVEDNLRQPFALRCHRGRAFDRGRVAGLLAGLGRGENFLAKSHRDLSGGEAQITALLRAVQLDPDALLLDEPTAALDAESARAAERLIHDWLAGAAESRALVWVSHDPAQAGRVTDRRILMRDGRLSGDVP